jgi:hypothetical protein
MKTKTMKAFILKALFTITCITYGFGSVNKCDAQSIVGKWKEVSGKDYCTAKGVKVTGKQFLTQAPQMGGQVLEIKSDHTFTSSELMTWVPSSVKLTGTWTLSGDQLNTKLDLQQADPINNPAKGAVTTIYTLTISGGNLVLSLLISNNPIVEKMEKTYTKM